MSDGEVIALAARMRARQKLFWKLSPEERPFGLLRECKALERELDEALLRRGRAGGPVQQTLFGPADGSN